ncbi:MAG: DUF4416 family protein, partial [Proteobacteria bacterium]|nr:DUF4416 family protein [Pseudomonadota bacterium]
MESSSLTRVKLIAAILYQDEGDLDASLKLLENAFSAVDFQGEFFPFTETDYYEPEMGDNLKRGMVSFERLVHPGFLVESKLTARNLEETLSREGKRRVNIDVGCLDMFKVVLASFKGRSNKIYLDRGIWADMILYFEKGRFKPFLWTFPDFK